MSIGYLECVFVRHVRQIKATLVVESCMTAEPGLPSRPSRADRHNKYIDYRAHVHLLKKMKV